MNEILLSSGPTPGVDPSDLLVYYKNPTTGKEKGYYGRLTSADFITIPQLRSRVGMTQGTPLQESPEWLKFMIDGKILYVTTRLVQNGPTWKYYNDLGVANGEKVITIRGNDYRVRLLEGANPGRTTPPTTGNADTVDTGLSEYSRLIPNVYSGANAPSMEGPRFDSIGAGSLDVGLGIPNSTFCREHYGTDCLLRGGGAALVTSSYLRGMDTANPYWAWRPCLERI